MSLAGRGSGAGALGQEKLLALCCMHLPSPRGTSGSSSVRRESSLQESYQGHKRVVPRPGALITCVGGGDSDRHQSGFLHPSPTCPASQQHSAKIEAKGKEEELFLQSEEMG